MNVAAHPLEWIYGTTHADPPACVAPEAATAGLDDAAVPMLERIERAMGALCAEAAGSPLQQMACEHLQAGGKRLRARLAFDAALLAGACEHDAVWWGAACEYATTRPSSTTTCRTATPFGAGAPRSGPGTAPRRRSTPAISS